MLKLGIIGAGTIFQNQIRVLAEYTDKYKVACVLDCDEEALLLARETLSDFGIKGVDFCTSLQQFLACDMDAILIATPPKTHFQLGLERLKAGKNVFMEKPAARSMEELAQLYFQAQEKKAVFYVAFHAAFGVEVEWLLKNYRLLAERFGFEKISKVYCGFYDPYVVEGKVLAAKENLEGSYADSCVNALSVCDRLLSIASFSTLTHQERTDGKGTVIASNTLFSDGKRAIMVDTGWAYAINRKRTVLQFENCKSQLLLDHSNQRIVYQHAMSEKEIFSSFHALEEGLDGEDIILFKDDSTPRLQRQYLSVFSDFLEVCEGREGNQANAERVHGLLFENI